MVLRTTQRWVPSVGGPGKPATLRLPASERITPTGPQQLHRLAPSVGDYAYPSGTTLVIGKQQRKEMLSHSTLSVSTPCSRYFQLLLFCPSSFSWCSFCETSAAGRLATSFGPYTWVLGHHKGHPRGHLLPKQYAGLCAGKLCFAAATASFREFANIAVCSSVDRRQHQFDKLSLRAMAPYVCRGCAATELSFIVVLGVLKVFGIFVE